MPISHPVRSPNITVETDDLRAILTYLGYNPASLSHPELRTLASIAAVNGPANSHRKD